MEEGLEHDAAVIDKIFSNLSRALAIQDVEEVLDIDLNFGYVSVLCRISMLKEPTMSELGKISGIQLSTLTRIVDKLVNRGLVHRKTDPSDRRVVRVAMTGEGAELVKRFEEARKKRVLSVLRCLTLKEREDLVAILQSMYNRIFSQRKETHES